MEHDELRETRMRLHGTGIWSAYGDAGLIEESAAELEELGYSAIWIPDVGGDVVGSVELLLRAASGIGVATGILNVWMQDPAEVTCRRALGVTRGSVGSCSVWE